MLDPMNLIYILIGNENDKSRTALDKVLSASKKRRCKVFLDIILNAEERVFKKFTTYLEKQMPVVYKYLVNARGQKGNNCLFGYTLNCRTRFKYSITKENCLA